MLTKPYVLKKTKTLFVFLKAQKNWAIKLPGPEAIWGSNSSTTFSISSPFIVLFHSLLLEYILVIHVFEISTFVSSTFSLAILK